MRKLSELSGDEFFDVIYALSPILPQLSDIEVIKLYTGGQNEEMVEKDALIAQERKKKSPDYKKIREANAAIANISTEIFIRDIAKIIPLLASKQNRGIVYDVLGIVRNEKPSEIKKLPAPELTKSIYRLFKDVDFGSFFTLAEPLESEK